MDSTAQPVQPWVAPRAQQAVDATIELPGSKSITNRALVIAALADGPSRLIGPLRARDTYLMAQALHSLGVGIEASEANDAHEANEGDSASTDGEGSTDNEGSADSTDSTDSTDAWTITPGRLHSAQVDVGLAGTVMRFLPPLAALAVGPVHFDGDRHARERPMATTIAALRQLGVTVEDGGADRLPFTVEGRGTVRGGSVHIDASASSQFVSGLLLSGARFDDGVVVVHDGKTAVPSEPHLAMTLAMLTEAGVDASRSGPGVWQVMPGKPAARDWIIEPDLSNAAPFLAAALVTSGTVTVPRWPERTTQPGDALRALLSEMGGDVSLSDAGLTVRGTGRIHGLTANLADVSELVPVLAALCALADSPSRLTGIAHMRGHETDRIAALCTELTAIGCEVRALPDGLGIKPRTMHGGRWHAYADHRMATAGAVIGLAVDGIVIDDIGATSKTMPGFPDMWSAMLAA